MYTLKFDVKLCAGCKTSDCLVKCQYMDVERDEAKREMIKIAKGEDSFVLRDCATCYNCEEYCPHGNHPFYLISERRNEKGILIASRSITNQMARMTSPQGQYEVGEIGERALSLCSIPHFKPMMEGRLFEDIRSSYILGNEFFCQVVHLHFANTTTIKEQLPKVIQNIKQLGIKELICLHDECYGSYVSLAPAYGMEVPFKPIHYMEYLFERLMNLKADIKPLKIKAAYQRNCSSRLSPDKYGMVEKIFDLIGVELVERRYQKENGLCCGGPLRAIDLNASGLEMIKDVQQKNIDDIALSGAEYCVSNCPFCQEFLSEKLHKAGVKPVHIIDLCKMALGEKQIGEVK